MEADQDAIGGLLASAGLTSDSAGIWVAPSVSDVSYPESGHLACAQIEDSSFWFAHRNAVIETVADRWLDRSGPFVDLGAGNGYVARGLADIGFDVVVIEPGRNGCVGARERGLETVVQATLAESGLADGFATSVGVFDVIEHSEDDVRFVSEISEALRPKGRLLLTVPAYKGLWSQSDVDAGHYRRYTRAGIAQVLERSGFDVLFGSYFFTALPPAIILGRTLRSRLGRDHGTAEDRMERRSSQHLQGPSGAVRAATWLFARELVLLRRSISLPAGASIVMVGSRR